MAIRIDVDVDINKAIEKQLKDFAKKAEKNLSTIEDQAKKMETAINNAFSNSKTRIDALISSLDSMKGKEGINQIIFAMKELNKAEMDGVITNKQYYEEMTKLEAKFKQLASQADIAGKSVKNVGGLDSNMVNQLKAKYSNVNVADIKKLDVPQLQQALVILKNQVEAQRLTGSQLQKNVDLQEVIKKQLKDVNSSTAKKLADQEKELKLKQQIIDAERRANSGKQYSYAMGLEANTLAQIKIKIDELRAAKQNLNFTNEDEKKKIELINAELRKLNATYKETSKEGGELSKQNRSTADTFNQLKTMAASYLSVYAVKNFVTEMAKVTGEFDLQRKSLAALLQNKEAADAIFERIKKTALQSPFTVMDLTTYTKQLAAYRIETENLYDTTYRLADISSGLGVDMGRLILAFGQVKAASVLRGQELRQFTEAGIPLVQLLADKFTELEKRTVSTGEVFDKISNRLVPFKMIDEIFKDMTESGGQFFEMQKLQAETIKGRLSNLTDAYQLMLDKLGSGGLGGSVIKGTIGAFEYLLKNFDGILTIMSPLIAAFGTYKTIMLLSNITLGKYISLSEIQKALEIAKLVRTGALTKANVALTLSQNGVNTALAKTIATNPYALAIAGVIALTVGIISLIRYSNKLNKELSKIETEGLGNFETSFNTFKRLAETIKDTTKTVQEQNDAYKELKRRYKDILPDMMLEKDYLKNVADGYDAVRAAIYNKIKAQINERKVTAIENQYGEKLASGREKVITDFQKNNKKINESDANQILDNIQVIIEQNLNDFQVRHKKIKEYLIKTLGQSEYSDVLNQYIADYGGFTYEVNKVTGETLKNVSKSYLQFGDEFNAIGKKLQESLKNDLKVIADPQAAQLNAVEFKRSYDSVINYYDAVLKKVKSMNINATDKDAIAQRNAFINQLTSELNSFKKEAETTITMINVIDRVSKQFGIGSATIMKYLKDNGKGFDEWGKENLDILKQRAETVELYNKADASTKGIHIQNKEAYDAETKSLRALVNFFGYYEEAKKGSAKNPVLDAIKAEIKLIEELTKKYKELRKEGMTDQQAQATISKTYAENVDAVNKILKDQGLEPINITDLIQGDPKKLQDFYKKQFEELKNNKEAARALGEALGEVGISVQIQDLDKIERDLQNQLDIISNRRSLSLEINESPKESRDLLMKMFGISEKDILSDIGSLVTAVNSAITEGFAKINVPVSQDFSKLTTEQFQALLKPYENKEVYGDIAEKLLKLFEYLQKEQKSYINQTGKAYGELLKVYADYNDQVVAVKERQHKEELDLDKQYFIAGLKQDQNYFKLKAAIAKKATKDIAAIRYEELKNSEEYINMFDRVGIMSEGNMVESYTKVRKGIVDAFESGTISLRTFKSSLAELDNQFKEFYMQTGKFVAYLQGGFDGLFKNMSETSYNIQAIASEIEKIGSTGDPVKFYTQLGSDNLNYLENKGINIKEIAKSTNYDTKAIAANLGKAASGMSQTAAKGASAAMWVQLIFTNIYGAIKGVNALRDAFDRLNESQGEFVSKYTSDNDKFWTTLGNFNEKTMQGFNQAKSGDLLGGIATAIESYVNIFSDFNELEDKQVQEQMDETTKAIDRMTAAMDRLQNAVDEQMGSDWLSGMNEIAEGYNQTAEDIQANIDAENSKKNPDEDVLYDLNEKLLDNQEKQKEIIDNMVEELTGTDLKSAAEDFANIWIDAFMAGEDAMGAIEERFGEMIKNMIVKALASQIVGKILEKTFAMVKAAVTDGKVTPEEIELINEEGQAAMTLINETLGGLGSWFQDILGTYSSFNGETLQKGIQQMTEETGTAVVSYLNTLRYEVYKHTNILTSIARDISLTRDIASAQLIQAQQHYQVALAIKQWTEVITTNQGNGSGIRVYSY